MHVDGTFVTPGVRTLLRTGDNQIPPYRVLDTSVKGESLVIPCGHLRIYWEVNREPMLGTGDHGASETEIGSSPLRRSL